MSTRRAHVLVRRAGSSALLGLGLGLATFVIVASSGCKARRAPAPTASARAPSPSAQTPSTGALASAPSVPALPSASSAAAASARPAEPPPVLRTMNDGGAAACTVVEAPSPLPGPPEPAPVAGYFYSMDRDGTVRRGRAGETPHVVARARPGTRFAVAALGAEHVVLAFLADRETSEGTLMQAFAVLDDGEPQRVSEEGSGATFVSLASRGDEALLAYIDARAALTPVHARVLRLAAGKLAASSDAVVFVGGAPEGFPRIAVAAPAKGPPFVLAPLPEDARRFGMAVIRLHEPPTEDEPYSWSRYPDGLSPAPVAAAVAAGKTYFARARPAEAGPAAEHVLELGRVHDGVVDLLGSYAASPRIRDVELAVDGTLLRVAYRTLQGWVTQALRCP